LELENIYDSLYKYCHARDFSGYDPFDGLSSRIFQATPLKKIAPARVVWLQMVKRSPFNLRSFLQVPKGLNSKGIALFALAELSRFRATQLPEHQTNARLLLGKLYTLRIAGASETKDTQKSAWGYNFDWQSRAFFAPRGTPTIVPTAFAARALIEGYELLKDEIFLQTAAEVCEFIVHDLNRSFETDEEICFSYTPLDRSIIFNASLLAGETLASVGVLTNNQKWLTLAEKSAHFVIRRQDAKGFWAYGAKRRHDWIDNFHTAFILQSLYRLQKWIPALQTETESVLRRGFNFWVNNFFLPDGCPKYYDNSAYPLDIHSAAAAIVALCELKDFDEKALPLAEKTAAWAIANMRDQRGFFYYQKRRFYTEKTTFIRWANAWMLYAMARLLEEKSQNYLR
jgi:hypothetical protein